MLQSSPAHFVDHFLRSSRETAETETLLLGNHGHHFTRKNAGFRARERLQAWSHAFPISHTSKLLTSWCGCHDDWWNQALATVSCTFCRPHLPKALRTRQFFDVFCDFYVKSSSRYSPVHICRQFSPIKPRNRGNDHGSHFTRKKKNWVARPRVCSSLNSHIPDLPHFPCMMMWLPWWLRWLCGYHHGEKASHDNRS